MENAKNVALRKVIASRPKLSSPDYYRPEVHFNYETLPAAKDWKVGGKYVLMIHVEQVQADKNGARFAIEKVGDCTDMGKKGEYAK